jgi:predicted DNA-binding transcriptional regulator YafY
LSRQARRQANLPPVTFTPAQAIAVAVALATQERPPMAAEGAAALEKLLEVMDADSRARAHALASRASATPGPPTLAVVPASATVQAIEDAARRHLVVVIDYVDGDGARTRRGVEPAELVEHNGNRYLVGWCRERDDVRWFRLDRVRAARLTDEPAPDRGIVVRLPG